MLVSSWCSNWSPYGSLQGSIRCPFTELAGVHWVFYWARILISFTSQWGQCWSQWNRDPKIGSARLLCVCWSVHSIKIALPTSSRVIIPPASIFEWASRLSSHSACPIIQRFRVDIIAKDLVSFIDMNVIKHRLLVYKPDRQVSPRVNGLVLCWSNMIQWSCQCRATQGLRHRSPLFSQPDPIERKNSYCNVYSKKGKQLGQLIETLIGKRSENISQEATANDTQVAKICWNEQHKTWRAKERR